MQTVNAVDRFADLVRVLAQGRRKHLIEIDNSSQMCTLAADIRNGRNSVSQNLVLNVKVPLLHVRPDRLIGNRDHLERGRAYGSRLHRTRTRSLWNNLAIRTHGLGDRGSLHRRTGSRLQRLRIRLVAVAVFEEHTITTANGGFAIALGIPSKADTRGRIEKVTLHTAV